MKFELTEKVITTVEPKQILEELERQFAKSAKSTERVPGGLLVKTITDTFGAANRDDTTSISLRPVTGGQMIVAEVNYKPSIFFWIMIVILLFTAFGWIFPIAFFFYNRTVVEKSIQATLQRVRNEFSNEGAPAAAQMGNLADELEKLSILKDKGVLTEDEFTARKTRLLQS